MGHTVGCPTAVRWAVQIVPWAIPRFPGRMDRQLGLSVFSHVLGYGYNNPVASHGRPMGSVCSRAGAGSCDAGLMWHAHGMRAHATRETLQGRPSCTSHSSHELSVWEVPSAVPRTQWAFPHSHKTRVGCHPMGRPIESINNDQDQETSNLERLCKPEAKIGISVPQRRLRRLSYSVDLGAPTEATQAQHASLN